MTPQELIKEKLKKLRPRFSDVLDCYITEWGAKIPDYLDDDGQIVNSHIYKSVDLSRDIFSKMLRNDDYIPEKYNICKIAFALRLPLEQTRYLLGLAGYALSDSNDFDIIFQSFVELENYDVSALDDELFAKGQRTFIGVE